MSMGKYMTPGSRYFIQLPSGRIKFTSHGTSELKPYFQKANVDMSTITTYEDYLFAREKAAPFLIEWVTDAVSEKAGNAQEIEHLIGALIND